MEFIKAKTILTKAKDGSEWYGVDYNMNYINELQKAIDYIEDNLDKDINFEIVAKEVGMSAFYFHRI